MLEFAEVAIGSGGVVPCTHCGGHATGRPRPAEEIASELQSRAASWGGGPGPNVAFVGFEAFAHSGLPALVHGAVECGFSRIRLRTDAGALSQPGNAPGVLSAGVRQFEVVLLGGAETHDRLSGRPGLFAAAEEGVRRLRSAAEETGLDILVSGLVPVCRHNAQAVADAVAALASFGALAVVVDVSARSLPDDLLQSVLDTGTVNRIAVSVPGASVPAPYDAMPWMLGGAS